MLDLDRRWLARMVWLAVAAGVGCAGYPPSYAPQMTPIDIPVDQERGTHVRMLVSLHAVSADRAADAPAGLEARLRIDNHTDGAVRLDPESLDLVGADLESFPTPSVLPAAGLDVSPGSSAMLIARFGYPAGLRARAASLRAVTLRWSVQAAGRHFEQSATFQRVAPQREYAYPPYWLAGPYGWYGDPVYDPWFWGVGPVFVFRGETGWHGHHH